MCCLSIPPTFQPSISYCCCCFHLLYGRYVAHVPLLSLLLLYHAKRETYTSLELTPPHPVAEFRD